MVPLVAGHIRSWSIPLNPHIIHPGPAAYSLSMLELYTHEISRGCCVSVLTEFVFASSIFVLVTSTIRVFLGKLLERQRCPSESFLAIPAAVFELRKGQIHVMLLFCGGVRGALLPHSHVVLLFQLFLLSGTCESMSRHGTPNTRICAIVQNHAVQDHSSL